MFIEAEQKSNKERCGDMSQVKQQSNLGVLEDSCTHYAENKGGAGIVAES